MELMKLSSNRRKKPLVIKFSGGLTAQLLALMSAVHLSQKLKRPFSMRYFPYSTGTYWPLGIGALLQDGELEGIRDTRGISFDQSPKPGEYIAHFPLRRGGLSYERLLQAIHKLHLDVALRWLRAEYVIGGQISRLRKVPMRAKSVSGIFPPVVDDNTLVELSRRIGLAKLPNPFEIVETDRDLVIHYRLGDMRKMPARNSEYGGHGVVDPLVFKQLVEMLGFDLNKVKIDVISDEPKLAQRLLMEAGFMELRVASTGSVWQDLATIASARHFLGSASQFSTFGAILCAKNGGQVFLPSSNYGRGKASDDHGVRDFSYADYRYLPADHWIFKIGKDT
jgi:hypothetical protein